MEKERKDKEIYKIYSTITKDKRVIRKDIQFLTDKKRQELYTHNKIYYII